jgi:hypothetical protein
MKYDWSKAPKGAIAAVRDEDGDAHWIWPVQRGKFWAESLVDMDYSAILDDSGDWRDSLELRPVKVKPMTHDREKLRLRLFEIAFANRLQCHARGGVEAQSKAAREAAELAEAAVNAFLNDAPAVDHKAPEPTP